MTWSYQEANEYLDSLEMFGMRFGLERMRLLMESLGNPQTQFETVHVVGSNGKTSTTWMTEAILNAHGIRAGSYTSPHLTAFTERVRIEGNDISQAEWGAAIERAAAASRRIGCGPTSEDPVTEFDVITAAAFDEFARREVEVAVVEAGLGGRFDSTNVTNAATVVLTSIALEHTRWLGNTLAEISSEKLAVAHHARTLVIGELPAEVLPQVEEIGKRSAVVEGRVPDISTPLRGYLRSNFGLAAEAARAAGAPLEPDRLRKAAEGFVLPGRVQVISRAPLTVVDGAHNPAGMAELVKELPEVMEGRGVVAVVSLLEDKDAEGALEVLLPFCQFVVFTESSRRLARPAGDLMALAAKLGFYSGTIEPDPESALREAQEIAGSEGAVLVTGSLFLVGDILTL